MASPAACESPPSAPRVASDRTKTPSSSACAEHADSVAQNRAAGKRAGRINGQDADGFVLFAEFADQRVGQRAFARAGRAGYADDKGFARVWEKLFDFGAGLGHFVFQIPDQAGGRADIACADFFSRYPYSVCRVQASL